MPATLPALQRGAADTTTGGATNATSSSGSRQLRPDTDQYVRPALSATASLGADIFHGVGFWSAAATLK